MFNEFVRLNYTDLGSVQTTGLTHGFTLFLNISVPFPNQLI